MLGLLCELLMVSPDTATTVVTRRSWSGRDAAACGGVLLPADHPVVPCLAVPACFSGRSAVASGFRRNGDNASAAQSTTALLCHTRSGLHINYTATDDRVISNFSRCHDPVWRMDALEFMIYPGVLTADPGGNYTEIDVGPQNALWAGHICNPSGVAPLRNLTVPISCTTSGIQWSANTVAGGWKADLFVPWAVISSGTGSAMHSGKHQRVWRANLARFDTPAGAVVHEQSAWSPTLSSSFHVPHRFGILVIDSSW